MRALMTIFLLVSLSACSTFEGFGRAQVQYYDTATLTETQRWWQVFHDPLMETLADQLLEHNIDIKIAASRIDEARALGNASAAAFFPDITTNGSATRQNKDQLSNANSARGGFDASWEIDLFGRVRANVDAADAKVLTARASREDVLNSMLAELIRAVIDWRRANETLARAQALLKAQDAQVSIYRTRAQAGLIDATFFQRAQAQREQTATQIPIAVASANTAEYQIERLMGKNPGDLASTLKTSSNTTFSVPRSHIIKNIPLDSIKSRPDVAAARADLLAAQANMREAEANLWPRITLSSFLGIQNISGSTSVVPSNPIWSLASAVASPPLNFARLRSLIEAANARAKQAELHYENTVLQALQEVHTALSDYVNGVNAFTQQQTALKHRQQTISLARTRFGSGLTDMTDLTTAQAELDQATLELITRKSLAATAYIRFHKSLGTAVLAANNND